MAAHSDINLDASRFLKINIPDRMRQLASAIKNGTVKWPATVHLSGAVDGEVPSRDAGRTVPVRVYRPDEGAPSRGFYIHIHGGGWTSFTHRE